jgi:PAS domain S-box-containing protein
VDDDENLLEIVKIFLEEKGSIRVDTVISAKDAQGKLAINKYDAIISDYEMPGMNGIEFLKYIRKKHGDLPFILFTGKGREEVVIQAINNGADFYLQKGGEPESQFAELSHKIRQAVQRRSAEASNRNHERREADILNFLPDATFAIDADGVVIAWNRAMEKMTGIIPSEILGKSKHEYALPFYHECRSILIDLVLNDDPATAARYPHITREGKNLFSEITIPHFHDGRGASLWFTASPLYDTGGAIVGAIESIRDVTARKQQEHILKAQLDLGLALQTTREMNATLEACLTAAIGISGMDSGGIYMVDEKTGSVDLAVSKNLGDEFVSSVSSYTPGSPNAEMVMTGKPIFDLFNQSGITFRCVEEHEGLRASAIIPISSGDRVIACMNLASHTLDEIPPTARVALETIATQIGAAIVRIRSEEALFESEQKYRNVVEDQTEFICRFLPGGTHVFVNDAYCRYFNMRREELIGKRFVPKIPDEDREIVTKHFRGLTSENPVATIIHRVILPDGSIRWHRWSDRVIFDEQKVLTEYQSVGRDITDIRQAEIMLQKREAELRSMLNATPVGVALLVNRAFQRVNQSLCTITGYSEEEMIGQSTGMLYMDDSAYFDTGQDIYDQIDREGLGKGEARLRRKDGTIIDVMLTLSPFDPANLAAGVTATVMDITDSKRAEEALRQSEKNYRSVIENFQDYFYKSDLEGNLILASPSFARFLEYESVEDLYGKSIAETVWFRPELRKELLDEIFRQGFVTSYPITLKKSDGTPVYVEVSSHVYRDDRGEIAGVEGTFCDVTDRRNAEEALRQVNRHLNLMTSITRHDILNKIMAMLSYLAVIKKKPQSPEIQMFIEKMESATTEMKSQIEFTRVYQDLGAHEPQWQDAGKIVLGLEIPSSISIQSALRGVEIYADPLLEKVFYNLLDNTAQHGKKATRVSISCLQTPQGLILVWEDDGVGVPDAEKGQIFERGFGKNNGLGLFLVREILSITGIAIREGGTAGEGARFEIIVPRGVYRLKQG